MATKEKESVLRLVLPADGNGRPQLPANAELIWDESDAAATNYSELGKRLAACGDLFRRPTNLGGGLIIVKDGESVAITKGVELSAAVVDRVQVQVIRDDKMKGSLIPAAHLNTMLLAESFLAEFPSVDQITRTPLYLPDGWKLTSPGYNHGEDGHRIIYLGGKSKVSESLDTITAFLNVMAFETPADRTNTVAAALTVLLRNRWPGAKPIVCVTATKSHAGKDTVIDFATGSTKSVSISYQVPDWPVEYNGSSSRPRQENRP